MARRRKKNENQVSLFPFLDVLSGVIGVLTLILIGMMLQSLQTAEQVIQIADGEEEDKRPNYVECREDGVIVHPLETEIRFNVLIEQEGQAPVIQQRQVSGELMEQSEQGVTLLHFNGERRFYSADDIIEQHTLTVEEALTPLAQMPNAGSRWQRRLRQIAASTRNDYVLFLLRPSGVKTFQVAQAQAKENFVEVGFEPGYDAGEFRFERPQAETTSSEPTAPTTDTP